MKCLFNFILGITNITPLISLVASRNTFRFPLPNLSGLDPNWIDDYAWPLLLSFIQFLFKTKISAKPTSVSCPWDFFSFSCLSFTFFQGIEIFESSAFPVTSAQVGSGVPWEVFIINESFSATPIQQKCYLNYYTVGVGVCIYIYIYTELTRDTHVEWCTLMILGRLFKQHTQLLWSKTVTEAAVLHRILTTSTVANR